jgi:adenylate cyclase class 2
MKKEIEVKVLNIDPVKLRKNLKKMGAVQVFPPTLFREIYWESPAEERIYSSFRLRLEGKKSFLTLKIKKEDRHFEVRDEFEVEVGDFSMALKILELAGFKIFREREKRREEYRIGTIKVEIDEYPKMRPYMEIEASSKKDALTFLKQLGFPLKYTTNRTATEVIQDAGLDPNRLLFLKKKTG